jgi:hypothetical protein
MNELATAAFYPVDTFAIAPFTSAGEHFRYLASEHKTHPSTQRNLCGSPVEAHNRYVSRHLFAQSVHRYCIDDRGPFKLFCDDFRPQNILVDPITLHITAVLDLEFTNVIPSQYASDPPWWLLLVGPDSYLFCDHTMQEFVQAYEPRLQRFMRALEQVEKVRKDSGGEKPLSTLMRESWATKRFWFDYAARKPFDVEVLFDSCIRCELDCAKSLDEEARMGLEPFIDIKMKQLRAYDDECTNTL